MKGATKIKVQVGYFRYARHDHSNDRLICYRCEHFSYNRDINLRTCKLHGFMIAGTGTCENHNRK